MKEALDPERFISLDIAMPSVSPMKRRRQTCGCHGGECERMRGRVCIVRTDSWHDKREPAVHEPLVVGDPKVDSKVSPVAFALESAFCGSVSRDESR